MVQQLFDGLEIYGIDGFRVRDAFFTDQYQFTKSLQEKNPFGKWEAIERIIAPGLSYELEYASLSKHSDDDRKEMRRLLHNVQQSTERVKYFETKNKEKVSAAKDYLAAALSSLSEFESDKLPLYRQISRSRPILQQVQATLLEDSAIVGFVTDKNPKSVVDNTLTHFAYVIRKIGDPIWIPIVGSGPKGFWNDEDEKRISQAKTEIGTRPANPIAAILRWKKLQSRLYDQWIRPLERHLTDTKHLVVISHGKLESIPLLAVTDRYDISYAPSSSIYCRLAKTTTLYE